jgi:hypothetical protein
MEWPAVTKKAVGPPRGRSAADSRDEPGRLSSTVVESIIDERSG